MSSPQGIEVRRATPADDARRDALARELPDASVHHLAGWSRAVARAFGHEPRDLVALRDGEPVGLLPMARCRSLGGKAHLISTPYGVYGGPIARDAEVARALVDVARLEAEAGGVGRLELRLRRDPEEQWGGLGALAASDLYVTFRRALPADPEEVLAITPKDERRLVRRARDRHGLSLAEGSEHVDELARLFHESKRRLGSPGLPLRWFRALVEELGDAVVVHAAVREGAPVAVSLSFAHAGELAMYYIGTTAEANRAFSATSFLIVELQEWAIRRGLRLFDLGRSRKDADTVRFKQNQGFEPAPLSYRFHLVRSRELPSFTPSNPRTERLRRTWSKLPPWATERLSGVLARYLP